MKLMMAAMALMIGSGTSQAATLKDWFVESIKSNLDVETIAIAPGTKVLIAGAPVPIFGSESCPRQSGSHVWFVGGDPDGAAGCIVVHKDTQAVPVRFAVEGKVRRELWTVERRGADQMFLRRQNGEYIVEAN